MFPIPESVYSNRVGKKNFNEAQDNFKHFPQVQFWLMTEQYPVLSPLIYVHNTRNLNKISRIKDFDNSDQ
jgi:hypothetical protein